MRECSSRCASELPARRGGKGIPNASGAKPGHPPSAARSAQRAPAPQPAPPRAGKGPEPWRPSEAPLRPPLPPKRGDQVRSRKKGPTTFFQRKTKPKRIPVLLPFAPRSTPWILGFYLPSRPENKHANHNPVSRPRTGPHTYEHPPAPGSSAGPRRYKASRSPTLGSRPQPPHTALPPPLTPTVPWSGRVEVAAAPRLTAGAPPSSRPPTRGGYGCTSRQGTHRIKSGTSPAAEWPKRARPQTSPALGRSAARLPLGGAPLPGPPLTAAKPGAVGWVCVPLGGCVPVSGGVLLGNCCSRYHGGSGGIARQFAVPALIALNSSLLRG